MNYSELLTTVQVFLNRTEADPFVPQFITLAEGEMNRRLDVREMTGVTSISISGESADVPCDFAGVKAFRLSNTSPVRKLEYVRPDAFDAFQDQAATGNGPQWYTIAGGSFLFWPVVSSTTLAKLRYRTKIAGLSAANPTNWLAEAHPDIYLYGALKHAGLFLGEERLPLWSRAFDEALDRANHDSITQNAGSTLQPQVDIYA